MTENLDRLKDPRMEYYHSLYKNSPKWDGEKTLAGKRVIIYCEQGLGDIIQMFRYVENVKMRGRPHITLHCPPELGTLFLTHSWVDEIIGKDVETLPEHDLHILSFSLPCLLPNDKTRDQYICFDERNSDVDALDDYPKIGIAWEGNKTWEGKEKGIFLKFFKPLEKVGQLYMLQKEIIRPILLHEAENMDLSGTEINDFKDTARLINSMDVVVSIDTCILHLAGALNKKTYGLLEVDHDPRWDIKNWYKSVKLLQVAGPWDEDWIRVFEKIAEELG